MDDLGQGVALRTGELNANDAELLADGQRPFCNLLKSCKRLTALDPSIQFRTSGRNIDVSAEHPSRGFDEGDRAMA